MRLMLASASPANATMTMSRRIVNRARRNCITGLRPGEIIGSESVRDDEVPVNASSCIRRYGSLDGYSRS
jgi:hypothetical protein